MNIIVGGGKYGCYAVEHLRKNGKGFVLVDIEANCLAAKRFNLVASTPVTSKGEYFMHGDLSTVLNLIETLKPEYVFPTVPVHMAADLLRLKFNLESWPEAINAILPKLPEAVVLASGRGKLIVSFNRDHMCIDKCSMPPVCPSSKIKKPCTMTELIRFACPEAFILVSYSMAPGMGALKGSELLSLLEWAEQQDKFVVATTCDCHGVLDALQKRV
ncbi:MAG: hypothetical protein N3E52_01270 [Candidatus Bathyarchaeota archaeon]|nr:hypothetical protein [Candidatus Bathyarchaeota archaeon]